MGDWWTTAPSRVSMENHEISSISRGTLSPSRTNYDSLYSSCMPVSKSSHNVVSAFCIDGNVPQCVLYINQELVSLGLSSMCSLASPEDAALQAVPTLNAMYELLQAQRRSQRSLEELEREQLRTSSSLDHLQNGNYRLKDQLELLKREKSGLHETERQLQLKIKTLQSCLKSEKEEIQKLQSIIASRASQYNHDAKRKERECVKLKERLGQLLIDKRDKKLAMDILNYLGRSDGKRIQWKTGKAGTSHEGDMYKSLLNDYEARQQSLMLENSELKEVLQQMKRDMMYILSPHKPRATGLPGDESKEQSALERGEEEGEKEGEEEMAASKCSGENLEQSCEQAREQLTNSIRLQWRRLKNHMEKLDSQVSLAQTQQQQQRSGAEDAVPREVYEEERQRMRLEVQQCRDFIHTQQQLLQQHLDTSFDDEILKDCYTLEEKERLKEEWRLFEEQKRNFGRERTNFTEAAIRLGREKKLFEEDRAAWLKNQFLSMTPFADRKRYSLSDSQSALSIRSEPESQRTYTPAKLTKSSTYAAFSTPTSAISAGVPSTTELYRTMNLIPNARHSKRGSWQESTTIQAEKTFGKSSHSVRCRDRTFFSLDKDDDSPP